MNEAASEAVVVLPRSWVLGGWHRFEVWWDGARMAEARYGRGARLAVPGGVGVHELEFRPVHTGGRAQRFVVELPGGACEVRSRFGPWLARWSEPVVRQN